MKNLPIKKGIEKLLRGVEKCYNGVWEIEGKDKYLKLTSDINWLPVKIPVNAKGSYDKVLRCAKVYKRLVEVGLYPPETSIVVCKDEGFLALMVVMPKLKVGGEAAAIDRRIRSIKQKISLDDELLKLGSDLYLEFNWGADKKGDFYAHDLHIVDDYINPYQKILRIAKHMGIK